MEEENKSIEEENKCISRNIKAIRTQRGLTQADVAKLLNISHRTYVKMENNPYELKIAKVKKLASVLNCSVNDFLLDNYFTKC